MSDKDSYEYYRQNDAFEVNVCSVLGDRDEQQDSAAVELSDCEGIVVVCDGMGGHSGGKIAAELASRSLVEIYRKNCRTRNIPEMLFGAVDILDEAVLALKDELGRPLFAGTTLCGVVVSNRQAYWVSVGDSRIYMIRGKEIAQVTSDHNYLYRLDEQLKSKAITQEEYESGKDKSEMLISFIGVGGIELVDINSEPLVMLSGDKILLTTDGLYKVLTEQEILSVVSNMSNIKDAAPALIKKVKKKARKGYLDNTTLALIKIK